MAVYPKAVAKLLPESASQPHIRPTQAILHSACNANHPNGTYNLFRDSSNLESHFLALSGGGIWQFIDTHTRADANYHANLRPDGTGAISIETDSSVSASEPFSPQQVFDLIALTVWLCKTHSIPARLCRNDSDPGIGWHVMWGAPGPWTPVSKVCPGNARIAQIKQVILPGVQAVLAGKPTAPLEENDMQLSDRLPEWADGGITVEQALWRAASGPAAILAALTAGDAKVLGAVKSAAVISGVGDPAVFAQAFIAALRTELAH